MGAELEDCKITYTLKFDSDMGQIQHVLKDTKKTYFRIPMKFYCFKFQVRIVAKLRNVTANAETDVLKYSEYNAKILTSFLLNRRTDFSFC